MELPQFNSYETAANYVSQFQNELSQSFESAVNTQSGIPTENKNSGKFADPPSPGGCTSPATYWANLPGSGGFLSSFRTYFTFNGVGISSATMYVGGVPIGWSWNQIGSTFNGVSNNGCIYGTITNGLQIGNITIGYVQDYHFRFVWNPIGCILTVTQGSGSC